MGVSPVFWTTMRKTALLPRVMTPLVGLVTFLVMVNPAWVIVTPAELVL